MQYLRDFLQMLSNHGICEYYKALFVVDHEEWVIIRTRIGVQKFS